MAIHLGEPMIIHLPDRPPEDHTVGAERMEIMYLPNLAPEDRKVGIGHTRGAGSQDSSRGAWNPSPRLL